MRLLLVRHAPSAATRRAAFGRDEPVDEAGIRLAGRLPAGLPRRIDRWLCSPSLAARQTAEAAGLHPSIDPELRECDFGRWAGLTLGEIEVSDPDGLRRWFEDPEAAPHAGESIAGLIERIRRQLERMRRGTGTVAALTHSGVVRAAVLLALDAPARSFWRIDVAPLSLTELHATEYGWRLAFVNHEIS